jgi:glycosyltransferase involved in cell wall biosynthesis
MPFPTFSIITPVHVHSQERLAQLYRAIDSVKAQTYSVGGSQEGLFEMLIVNDGSIVDFTLPDYPWLKRFDQPHLERNYACNNAMKNATKEWFCFLDSDDMYSPYYLEAVAAMINNHPDYKMFNFASLHIHPNYSISVRGSFRPAVLEKGHAAFGGGQIVNGTFVFNRECYEKLGGFPETTNPWDFSAQAQKEFPELKEIFTIINEDNPNGVVRELGNPWGQDFYYFYKLTREYHCLPCELPLYWVFHKGQRALSE